MKYDARACHFNMDTGCVELLLRDGRKISIHSLGFRIFVLLAVMIVFFCALVVYNNTAAFGLMLERIHENSENTLVLYQKSLDENLSRPETYLYVFALNDTDLLSLRAAEPQTTSWYTTLNRIKKSFENAAPNYTVDGFFCYQEATDALVLYDQTSNPPPLLWNYIRGIANTEAPSSVWNLNEINGKYYLVRILNLNGYLLGAYISTDTLLGTLVDTKTQDSLLYFSDGSLLLRTPSNDVRLEAPRLKWRRYPSYEIDGTSWMAVSHELKETPLSLTLLLKDSEYTKYQTNFYIIAFIVSLGLFVVWLLLSASLYRWVLHPVHMLTHALEQLRGGDLKVRIPDDAMLDEFREMTTAFNDMVEEIDDLKIENYEKQLSRQKLEALYLKQQITPHFMINCLNTIYQLTENNHADLARQMLQNLSVHLRYTLSSGQTVSLLEELKLVKNYVELSSIRYPGALRLLPSCEESLHNATVVPLMLLNFVENTVKYEVVMGKVLDIHIDVTAREKNQCTRLHICIWDTGRGFSENMLAVLQNLDTYVNSEQEHIGITNVVLRLRQIFPDAAFTFCNRSGAGAQITIDFPYVPFFRIDG